MPDTDTLVQEAELLEYDERLVVAPSVGVFRALPPETVTAEGEWVAKGQAIAVVEAVGIERTVNSPHRGLLMGLLARDGERVRAGQPVAWLRPAAG